MYFLLTGGLCLTVGDIIMKRWLLSNDLRFAAAGMGVWALGLCCLASTMKTQNIAVASVILVFFNVGTLTVAEWYFFHNALSVQQMAGLLLGLVAVCLLQAA